MAVAGLKESMKHEWSGDADLNDGKLETLLWRVHGHEKVSQ